MTLTIRSAHARDLELVWHWRNDGVTRANSLRPDPVSWTEHRVWFARHLADPHTRIYLLEDSVAGAVAQIRYEAGRDGCTEVHLTVAPAFRRRGYGTKVLRDSLAMAYRDLKIARLEAIVKSANVASLRTFRSAGFVVDRETLRDGCACVIFRFDVRPAAPLPSTPGPEQAEAAT